MDTHIDYIRLASWEFNAYVEIMPFLMDSWPNDWIRGKWLQYAGWRKEGLFVGRGMQGNRAHTILNISGSNPIPQPYLKYLIYTPMRWV